MLCMWTVSIDAVICCRCGRCSVSKILSREKCDCAGQYY